MHRLRNVPLKNLTAGDLRLLIGQRVGLPYLVPVALDVLAIDTFIDASFYPGDLLAAVVGAPNEFWHMYSELAHSAVKVARSALERIDSADVRQDLKDKLRNFIEARTKE